MLPCNVVVQDCGGDVEVAAIDPAASMQAIPNAQLREKADEVAEKLRRAIGQLAAEQGVEQPDGLMSEIEAHAALSRGELDSIAPAGTDPLHEGP